MTTTMTDPHTTKAVDSDLQDLERLVAEMGGLAEKQVADSINALAKRDIALGQRIYRIGDLLFGEASHFGDQALKVLQVAVDSLGRMRIGHCCCPSVAGLLVAHDLVQKPVSTFRNHAASRSDRLCNLGCGDR